MLLLPSEITNEKAEDSSLMHDLLASLSRRINRLSRKTKQAPSSQTPTTTSQT